VKHLRDVTIGADRTCEREKQFNLETSCVCTLFSRCIAPFDTGGIQKIVLVVGDRSAIGNPTKLLDVVELKLPFDYASYWSLNGREKKKVHLDTLISGVSIVASAFDWSKEPFEDAAEEVMSLDFKNEGVVGKPLRSPAGKSTAQLSYAYELDRIRLTALIRANRTAPPRVVGSVDIPPHPLWLANAVKGFRWRDATTLEVPDESGTLHAIKIATHRND